MRPITGLSSIIDRYDALLLDLWGVVHDGTHLYPNVLDALKRLREANKKIIMLSNAPRRAIKAVQVLEGMGITPALYDMVLTSGEAGYQWLAAGGASWDKRYYYIGPAKDADILNGLDYRRTDDIKQADFLLNVGFGSEAQSTEDWQPLLRAARAQATPMLCLNPDLEVVKQTGERFACAGVIAQAYERMGGEVIWFGKPYPAVYEICLKRLAPVKKERVLVVGDSVGTDIKGAVDNGMDSVLVTGGILNGKRPDELSALCRECAASPDYVMPRLAW